MRAFNINRRVLFALLLSVVLHGLVFVAAIRSSSHPPQEKPAPEPEQVWTIVTPLPAPAPVATSEPPPAPPQAAEPVPQVLTTPATPASPAREPASMAAPPAPTPEEWALASTYKLKNSKRYRYNWGQQVRSMMGTAVEGPDQGVVHFRVEIAPDGKLARLVTLWSTSDVAEKLARAAIERMPPLPPTPTGKPLIFEKTISFQPFDTGWPPIYTHDCRPDPPKFRNPFAWDGKSPQSVAQTADAADPPEQSYADCKAGLPENSLEAESRDMVRQWKQWRSNELDPR